MKSMINAKTNQLEHSRAKVDLYAEYLAIYLNILGRAANIRKVFIFDLMCGEGIYEDGSAGSAVVGVQRICHFANSNSQLEVSIVVWLNDPNMSLIEKQRKKIDRVRDAVNKIALPHNVKVDFLEEEFSTILPKVVKIVHDHSQARAFVFIDPHGYKNVKPSHIKTLLDGGKTEVLLFIPATFLYRFIGKSIDSILNATEPLWDFMTELFPDKLPIFLSVEDFIKDVKTHFKDFLANQRIFVDTFTIERDARNLYCLYFFTSSIRGFQKMLEAKWKLDDQRGKGYRIEKTKDLFSDAEVNQYPEKLLDYLKTNTYCTNKQLFLFGLHNGYLPKHTNAALNSLRQQGRRFDVSAPDGNAIARKAFHIGDENITVHIKLTN